MSESKILPRTGRGFLSIREGEYVTGALARLLGPLPILGLDGKYTPFPLPPPLLLPSYYYYYYYYYYY